MRSLVRLLVCAPVFCIAGSVPWVLACALCRLARLCFVAAPAAASVLAALAASWVCHRRIRLRALVLEASWYASVCATLLYEELLPPDCSAEQLFLAKRGGAASEPPGVPPGPCLTCKRCGTAIVRAAELVMSRYHHRPQTRGKWFPSEMELLEVDDVPTYGGVRAHGGCAESYIVRVKCTEGTLANLCLGTGETGDCDTPTGLLTWFPPFKWTLVYCKACNPAGGMLFDHLPNGARVPQNLGWLFTPPPGCSEAAFLGLRVTEMREWWPDVAV